MKKRYVKPLLEPYGYRAEEGYASSIALEKDYLLIQGDDNRTLRSAEEVAEYTDSDGEFSTGGDWD
jgi:hypothetical protein